MTPRIDEDGATQYDIIVRPEDGTEQVYRTLSLLDDAGKYVQKGRGTRVWKAVLLKDGEESGAPVALKDGWVDEHRPREGDINAQVFASATSDEDRATLRGSVLKTIAHGDVFVAGSRDSTASIIAAPAKKLATSSPVQQTHYRLVYEEVGTPLDQVTSLRTVFSALIDATKGTHISPPSQMKDTDSV